MISVGFLLSSHVLVFDLFDGAEMVKNVPVNGTLEAGQSISFNTKDAKNWDYVIYGFQLTSYSLSLPFTCSSNSNKFMEKVGSVKLSCDVNTVEMCGCVLSLIRSPLESDVPSTRFFEWMDCQNKNTTITFTNTDTDKVHFWGILAEIDGLALPFP